MTSRRLFTILLTIVLLLGLGIFGAGYGADAVLSSKATELDKLKAESEAVDDLQTNLKRNKEDLKQYKELNEIAKVIVPQDKDQTQTVREIVRIAEASGITRLNSVTFPGSTLGTAAGNGLTQVTPVKGMSGVYLLPITVTVNKENAVPYNQLIAFLRGLEQNRRTAQVASLNLQPDEKNPNNIAFTLIINEYIKP